MRISDWSSDVCSSDLNRDPTTGMVTSLVHEADAAAVDEAVSAARRALHGPWAGFTDAQRADAMRRIAEGVRSRFDEFLAAEIRDTGKPSAMASHLDIPRGAANFDVFADQIANTSTERFRTPTPDGRSEERRAGPEGVSTSRSR